MISKSYFNFKLMNGIDKIKSFNEDLFVKYFSINNIEISKFKTPVFDKKGRFLDGPLAYREEYNKYVQPKLKEIANPCLYIFEVVDVPPKLIHENYLKFLMRQMQSDDINKRACAKVRNPFNQNGISNNSNILYVGKSQNALDGRIVVHFGYYEKPVAGLQLVFWGRQIDLKINLHIFEFQKVILSSYLEVIEKLLFIELAPIIGKR